MSIAVTGATGHLGHLVVTSLLDRDVPPGEVVALGRDVGRLAGLAERGVTVRAADYDDPGSLPAALAGVDTVLLVSGNVLGQRVRQHGAVLDAAQAAGVRRFAYTSAPHAGTATHVIAAEHRATEQLIAASGLPAVILRNGWYFENYTAQLPAYLRFGIAGAAGDGRIAGASRADLAEAAAVVLSTDGHAGQVYELGGPAFTLAEFAAKLSRQVGREITYTDLPVPAYVELLVGAGVPEPFAEALADADRAARQGELDVDPTDLTKLLGRPASSLAEAIRAALATG